MAMLTIQDGADQLQISLRTARRAHQIRSHQDLQGRPASALRVRQETLDAYLAEHESAA
jgi:hypothetical protein